MHREECWPRVLRILTTDSLSDNESLEVNVVDSVGVEVVVVEDRLGDCNNEPGWARNQEPIYHVCYAINCTTQLLCSYLHSTCTTPAHAPLRTHTYMTLGYLETKFTGQNCVKLE